MLRVSGQNRVQPFLLIASDMTVEYVEVKSMIGNDIAFLETKIEELKPQVLFGVGGGTIIDAAKVCSGMKKSPS